MSTTTDIVQSKAKTLQALLEVSKKQIEAALPRHLTPDRLLRIAMTEARKNPTLLECTQASFIGAIIQTAQIGLEPGAHLGHAYLVPFKNKRANNQLEVQLIIGYRGMIDLAYRSPKVSHPIARAVYEGDEFEYEYGTNERLLHRPDKEATGKQLTHVYAIVFLIGGGKVFDVMEVKEIEAARKRSKSADSGPWETDYEAMAKKSVVRRLFKYMPVSIELQEAIGLDESGERGEQNNGAIFEAVGTPVPDPVSTKNKTFQENVGAISAPTEEDPPAAEPVDSGPPERGSFQEFSATSLFDNRPAPTPKTKEELVGEIFDAAEVLGIDVNELEKISKREFKKAASTLTNDELAKFLEVVKSTEPKTQKKGTKK